MLEEYARKRKFSRTPEPAPSAQAGAKEAKKRRSAEGGAFCVQRHDASRLHYDFRLEVDGVLKSWAVPKGPSLDPGVRHLAAHVEDHPLEYGGFEGNIPEGEYGAGSVMLWDRGTYELLDAEVSAADQLERGDFKFRLAGEKLHGDFALVRMKRRPGGKGNEWLLIKKRDEFAADGWNVEDYAWSVLSGRSQEEIAQNLPAHKRGRHASAAPADVDPEAVWTSNRAGSRASRSAAGSASAQRGAAVPAAKARAPKVQAIDTRATATKSRAASERTKADPALAKAAKKKRVQFDPSALPGARKAALPEWFEPMSATLITHPPEGTDWLFEVKWDGVRALCFVDEGELRIYSRRGNRCERQYPELSVLPHYIAARQAVLDGEIAVLDKDGISRFELIQPRIANSDPAAVARLAHRTPAVLYLFDILYLDGYDLRNVPLGERRRALVEVVTPSSVVRLSEAFTGNGEELLAAARENGLEGIVAKRASSTYESRRSRQWLKLKLVNEQEFVICGFTAGEGARKDFGALVLGAYEGGELKWVGNVGTGFTAQTVRELLAKLEPLAVKQSPLAAGARPPVRGVTWVRPELVAQIKFTEWTRDRHLRAPVFLGLRDDVVPQAVRREAS
jgi:bifunctional non-homologous end joining protein LigD